MNASSTKRSQHTASIASQAGFAHDTSVLIDHFDRMEVFMLEFVKEFWLFLIERRNSGCSRSCRPAADGNALFFGQLPLSRRSFMLFLEHQFLGRFKC